MRFVALLFLVLTVGCKAMPAPPAGFIQPDPNMIEVDGLPFHVANADPKAKWMSFDRLAIAPIDTSYLLENNIWEKISPKDPTEDAKAIADEARAVIEQAFKKDPKHRFEVVAPGSSKEKTLALEVAIVDLVPTKVVTGLAGYAGGFLVPGVGYVRAFTKGIIAFEARVRDLETGRVIATFADRERTKLALINFENLTYYGFVDSIVEEWAGQFVALSAIREGGEIEDSPWYKISPW